MVAGAVRVATLHFFFFPLFFELAVGVSAYLTLFRYLTRWQSCCEDYDS